eukprot:3597131-Amphidinium_carterae.1
MDSQPFPNANPKSAPSSCIASLGLCELGLDPLHPCSVHAVCDAAVQQRLQLHAGSAAASLFHRGAVVTVLANPSKPSRNITTATWRKALANVSEQHRLADRQASLGGKVLLLEIIYTKIDRKRVSRFATGIVGRVKRCVGLPAILSCERLFQVAAEQCQEPCSVLLPLHREEVCSAREIGVPRLQSTLSKQSVRGTSQSCKYSCIKPEQSLRCDVCWKGRVVLAHWELTRPSRESCCSNLAVYSGCCSHWQTPCVSQVKTSDGGSCGLTV